MKIKKVIAGAVLLIILGWLPYNPSLEGADNDEMKFPRFIVAGSEFRRPYNPLPDGKILTIREGMSRIRDMNCQGFYLLSTRMPAGAYVPDFYRDKANAEKFVSIARAHQLRTLYCVRAMWTMPREIGTSEGMWGPIPKEYLKQHNVSLSINDPETLSLTLKAYEQIFERYGKDVYGFVPGDEANYGIKKDNEDDLREYKRYLKESFSQKTLKHHGIEDIEKIEQPGLQTRAENPFLWSTYWDFIDKSMVNYFTRQKEFFHKVNPGIKMIATISAIQYLTNPLSCSFSKYAPVFDVVMTDLYTGCCGTVEGERSMLYEMLEYANPGGVWPVPGAYYLSYPRQLKRRIYLTAMHADGVNVFNVLHSQKERGLYQKEQYQAIKETYGNLSRIEDYLYKCQTVSPVGIIFSEKTLGNHYAGWTNRFPYFAHISGLWIMGLKSHIPMRALILDTIASEKLEDFKVLILPKAECISDKQIDIINEWVKKGGILISDGETSLYTEHGIRRDDYGLKEVLGISYHGQTFIPDRTFSYNNKEFTYYKDAPSVFKDSPLYQVSEVTPLSKTEVISSWNNQKPAILFHPYGKGGSIFITASSLGTKCFTKDPSIFTSLWKDIVELALDKTKTKLPVYLSDCPEEIEVNLREQKFGMHKNRILHLLVSYEANLSPLKKHSGIRARIQIPENYRVLDLIEPLTAKSIPYKEGKDYVEFRVPSFKLYKCLVLKTVKGKRGIKGALPFFSTKRIIKKEKERKIPKDLLTTIPSSTDRKIRVAIFKGAGAAGIYEALKKIEEVSPEHIKTIDSSTLTDEVDVLIFPAPGKGFCANTTAKERIKDWVEKGHGLLVTHGGIGYRYAGRSIFPEISAGGLAHPTVPYFTPTKEHPVVAELELNRVYPTLAYIDHIQVEPGKNGYAIAKDYILGEGKPVVVIGKSGKGRYVACGLYLGETLLPNPTDKKGLPLSGAELKLLINSVKWLALPAIKGQTE